MKQVALRLDDDLAALIDKAAGQVPRERWIKNTLRRALEARLSGQGSGDTNAVANPGWSRSAKETAPTESSVSLRAHPQSCRCGVCQALKGKP